MRRAAEKRAVPASRCRPRGAPVAVGARPCRPVVTAEAFRCALLPSPLCPLAVCRLSCDELCARRASGSPVPQRLCPCRCPLHTTSALGIEQVTEPVTNGRVASHQVGRGGSAGGCGDRGGSPGACGPGVQPARVERWRWGHGQPGQAGPDGSPGPRGSVTETSPRRRRDTAWQWLLAEHREAGPSTWATSPARGTGVALGWRAARRGQQARRSGPTWR